MLSLVWGAALICAVEENNDKWISLALLGMVAAPVASFHPARSGCRSVCVYVSGGSAPGLRSMGSRLLD